MNASFPLRFKAFMIDYALILAYGVVLFSIHVFIFPSLQDFFKGSLVTAQFTGFLMVTFPVSLYFIICDSVMGGKSVGKRKTGIQVVDQNTNSLSVPHAIFRTMLKFLPWELSHYLVYRLVFLGDAEVPLRYTLIGVLIYVLIFAYILTAIFTKKKRSLYDICARTQVIKVSN